MWELAAAGLTALVLILMALLGLVYSGLKGTVDKQGETICSFADKLTGAIDKLETTIKAVEDGSRESLANALREQSNLVTALREEMSADIKDHEKRLFSLSERMHEGQGALLEIKNQVAREYMPVEQLKDNFEKIDVKFDRTDAKFEKSVASIEQTLKLLPELNTKVVMLAAKVDDLSKRS